MDTPVGRFVGLLAFVNDNECLVFLVTIPRETERRLYESITYEFNHLF